jgi:hypothetical protein
MHWRVMGREMCRLRAEMSTELNVYLPHTKLVHLGLAGDVRPRVEQGIDARRIEGWIVFCLEISCGSEARPVQLTLQDGRRARCRCFCV